MGRAEVMFTLLKRIQNVGNKVHLRRQGYRSARTSDIFNPPISLLLSDAVTNMLLFIQLLTTDKTTLQLVFSTIYKRSARSE